MFVLGFEVSDFHTGSQKKIQDDSRKNITFCTGIFVRATEIRILNKHLKPNGESLRPCWVCACNRLRDVAKKLLYGTLCAKKKRFKFSASKS
jgi:hypothetical protein